MIGIRSAALVLLCALSVGVPLATGALDLDELGRLSVASCLVLGALTSLGVGLVGIGGGLGRRGGAAFDLRRRIFVDDSPTTPQLPGAVARLLLGLAFFTIAATALGNHGVVRLRELGAGGPPTGRCKPPVAEEEEAGDEPEPPPPPPPVDQAGCALVRRAYQLGYAKSLGSCAPKTAAAPAPVARQVKAPPEPCTRQQLDEPFLHYAWRRWGEVLAWFGEVRPVRGSAAQAEEVRTKLEYFGSLTASSGHALSAVPHAAHHVWIALPDPRPASWLAKHLAGRDCEARYADVPLWRSWSPGQEGALIEHALGQLLFSSRFGTTTACANYRLHWGAGEGACDRLVKDPETFLKEQGQWEDVAGVLDRRRRQLELRALAEKLGKHAPPEPPPAQAVVSLSCVRVDGALAKAEVSGEVAMVEGQRIGVRQLRLAKIAIGGDGPIEVVAQLAGLLAGGGAAGAPGVLGELDELAMEASDQAGEGEGEGGDGAAGGGAAADASASRTAAVAPRLPPLGAAQRQELLNGSGFALARLEALEGTDPFAGDRWPLARPELVAIYPLQRSLFSFIDGFRRRYFAQRGRL